MSLSDRAPSRPPEDAEPRRIDDLMPIPQLSLGSHQALNYHPASGRMVQAQQHRAGLAFLYGSARVHGRARSGERVLAHGEDGPLSIARQPEAEQRCRDILQQLGFSVALRQSQALPKNFAEAWDLPGDSAWLRFVEQLPTLRRQGWQISLLPGFAFDLTPVQALYAQVRGTDTEGLDLELGVQVQGERLSLLPPLLRLLRANPALLDERRLAQRSDDEPLRLTLDGRRESQATLQVVLPLGRLKPILALLGDLYLREDLPAGDSLHLARPDAARLTLLSASELCWSGAEQWLAFAERLRDYRHRPTALPSGLQASLRAYQRDGLNWMQTLRELGAGGVLADDMGLGKTLQTLAHLLCEKEAGRLDRPCLAVVPTSLVPNWLDEAARFAPGLRVLSLHGTQRRQHFDRLAEHDLLLTTYALLPRDIEALQAQPLHVLVLDEAQNIKNATSKAAQAARSLQARQRLCLSGTPLENHLGELWSLFHFLMPGWLGDERDFNRDYRFPIEKQGDQARLQHLHARLRPFLLRRKKEDVARELPPKNEIIQWVELSPAQRDLYETVRQAMDRKVREEIERKGLARSQLVVVEALLKLRQVCCDLRLVRPVTRAPRGGTSGKLDTLLEMLQELLAEGRRVLLFSQFTSMLSLIEERLHERQIEYVKITGKTADRRTPVERFQNGEVPLFLISLKAGGTGLNLTAADTVIHYDPWWNPASEDQATDRAYRIGQDKPVFVYKLIARGTIEEKISRMQQRKSTLADEVLVTDGEGHPLDERDIEALLAPLP